MSEANYIIFHPDSKRKSLIVSATVMIENNLLEHWIGNIFVDKIGKGNEDPFVFHDPWLFSYCHASQLRRTPRTGSYLKRGSRILFVSGQKANDGLLTIDTFFLVGNIQMWRRNPTDLPIEYRSHFRNNSSDLWKRHFRFPFHGIHSGVTHTYEAEIWHENKIRFSYLPLDKEGQKVSISFDDLDKKLSDKISKNVRGKYPVLLDSDEMSSILDKVEKLCHTKVLSNINAING